MKSTVEHQSRVRGPVTVSIETVAARIEVASDERAGTPWFQLIALDGDPEAVRLINQAEFRDGPGGQVSLRLREDGTGGGFSGVQYGSGNVQHNFGVQYGSGNVQHNSGVQYGSGNVQHNSFGGGMTVINGVRIGRIVVRALIPVTATLAVETTSGSVEVVRAVQAQVDTTSGSVSLHEVGQATVTTVSGGIEADGVQRASTLRSTSGSIHVQGDPGAAPAVTASTVSGGITASGVQLKARTVSGRIRER